MRHSLFILTTLVLICLTTPAGASKGFLGLSIGYFSVLDSHDHAADLRLEYRPDTPVFLKYIKPWAGIEATSDGTVWAGGGFLLDLKIKDRFAITPSLGVGYYNKGNSEIDLDYPLQFRSQLEISYIFQNDSRLGLAFSHMSNAGLGDHNPGVEALMLSYVFPLNWLSSAAF